MDRLEGTLNGVIQAQRDRKLPFLYYDLFIYLYVCVYFGWRF